MTGKLRIIAGQWRGRRIPVLDRPGLRPSGDRVRETLFNWLGPRVVGRRVLDLYAGTGALGLEAVSRGASSALLVERDGELVRAVKKLIADWPEQARVSVVEADVGQWIHQPGLEPFDLIFLDPPFDQPVAAELVSQLQAGGALAPGALLYVEAVPELSGAPLAEALGSGFDLVKHKVIGRVGLSLLASRAPSEP